MRIRQKNAFVVGDSLLRKTVPRGSTNSTATTTTVDSSCSTATEDSSPATSTCYHRSTRPLTFALDKEIDDCYTDYQGYTEEGRVFQDEESETDDHSLDDLIAETSARWKEQLHVSLLQCKTWMPMGHNNMSPLLFANQGEPISSTSTPTSPPPLQQTVVTRPSRHPSKPKFDDSRTILQKQRQEIQALRSQLLLQQGQQQATVPPQIVVPASSSSCWDDLTLDL